MAYCNSIQVAIFFAFNIFFSVVPLKFNTCIRHVNDTRLNNQSKLCRSVNSMSFILENVTLRTNEKRHMFKE